MHKSDEQQKRNDLEKLLYELAANQDVLKEKHDKKKYYQKFEEIYHEVDDENFRHFYSDIFSLLTVIDGDPSIGNIDILAQNMDVIKNGYKGGVNRDSNGNCIDVSKEIVKLYDHINLDVSRLNYTKRITENTESELAQVRKLISNLQNNVDEAKSVNEMLTTKFDENSSALSDKIQNSQKEMQNEYITILGIFASIVLAFTGGMSFTSSVLQNLHKSSIYRIVFVVLIVGWILYNLMWGLMDFVQNISGKHNRKLRIITYIIINILFLLMIIFDCFGYKYDWFNREEKINKFYNEQAITFSSIVKDV